MKAASLVAALAGLAIATAIIAWFGASTVLHAVLSAGWRGFALFTLCQVALFLILGAAWQALAPEIPYKNLVASRAVRDAASNCLPFSHLGGLALGVRAAILQNVPWARAAATSTADVTAEFFAQIAYAIGALAWLFWRVPASPLARPIALALVPAVVVIALFVLAQNGAGKLFAALGKRIAGDVGTSIDEGAASIDTEFTRVYAAQSRLALSAAIHLLGWLGSGIATFVGFRALGAAISLPDAIAVEGLVDAAMIFAFLIPGQLGAQEAAFVAMGAAFGVPAPISLGLSLLRRGRDVAIGVPVLLIWQGAEAARLRREPAAK